MTQLETTPLSNESTDGADPYPLYSAIDMELFYNGKVEGRLIIILIMIIILFK